jgi:hypothetical protein
MKFFKNFISLYLLVGVLDFSGRYINAAASPCESRVAAIVDDYDSDSEDEDGYSYRGLPHIAPTVQTGSHCLFLSRGIHFARGLFSKADRSRMRRQNAVGQTLYASAAYDMAGVAVGSTESSRAVEAAAVLIKQLIGSLGQEQRHTFQQEYSNSYEGFHKRLGTLQMAGIFRQFTSKKNPQVSTSEYVLHSSKYASGLKFLGNGSELLDPEYDDTGKPKHPYLGNLYVIMVNIDDLEQLNPYFVVHGHANNFITICTHFSRNILEEREVSFPGLIPGKYVVFSVPVRVPSFAGEYKAWYQDKYGISKRVFENKKKAIVTGKVKKNETRSAVEVREAAVCGLLRTYIIPHLDAVIKDHVKRECDARGIVLCYRSLSDGFEETLPSLVLARDQHNRLANNGKSNMT